MDSPALLDGCYSDVFYILSFIIDIIGVLLLILICSLHNKYIWFTKELSS